MILSLLDSRAKGDFLIEVHRVTKSYGRKVAIQDLSFTICEGETIGIVGVNGAGKTTLSSVLAGVHPPTKGNILWRNHSIYSDIVAYRTIVGYCPQKANLDRMLSLDDSLQFAGLFFGLSKRQIVERKERLMEQFGLTGYAAGKVGELSGGYKQRFLLARMLMHNPKILILDEATMGLDPHMRHQLWKELKQLKEQGMTIVLTTHYLEEADFLADRICLLHQGEIKAFETPEKMKELYKTNKLEDVMLNLHE